MDTFDSPSTGVKITDFEGQLLLLTPTERLEEVQTTLGPTDATVANLTILDGQGAGETHPAVMIFQKVLQGQLRSTVNTGRHILGRLERGEAKRGQSAPWKLSTPTEADKALARAHLAANGTTVDSPQVATPPPIQGQTPPPANTAISDLLNSSLSGLTPLQREALAKASGGEAPF